MKRILIVLSVCVLPLGMLTPPTIVESQERVSEEVSVQGYLYAETYIIQDILKEHHHTNDHDHSHAHDDHDHGDYAHSEYKHTATDHRTEVRIQITDGEDVKVSYDEELQESILDGLESVVVLTGEYAEEDEQDVFKAYSVEPIDSDQQSYGISSLEDGDIKYAVLQCTFSDSESTVLTDTQFTEFFSDQYPGINDYYQTISYGNLNVTADVFGPFDVPGTIQDYTDSYDNPYSPFVFRDDCINAALETVDLMNYEGIILAPSDQYSNVWLGKASIGKRPIPLGETFEEYYMVWLQPDGFSQFALSHEIGHNLRWLHSGGPYGRVYDSNWDVMSNGKKTDDQYPQFGDIAMDTIINNKDDAGWIPSGKTYNYKGFGNVDLKLESHGLDNSQWKEGSYLSITLPGDNSREKIYAEARFQEGLDSGVPGTGVVLHRVDEFGIFTGVGATLIDQTENGDPNDDGSFLEVGESYIDEELNYSLEVVAINEDEKSFDVRLASSNPSIELIVPDKEVYAIEETVPVEVRASDDGDITEVAVVIYSGSIVDPDYYFEEVFTEEPYALEWRPNKSGQYYIISLAVDDEEHITISDTETIQVVEEDNYWSEWRVDEFAITPHAVTLQEFDGKLFQSYVGYDNRVYTRYSSTTDAENIEWSLFETSDDVYEYTDHSTSMTVAGGKLYQTHTGQDYRIYTRSTEDGVTWGPWRRNAQNWPEYTDMPVYITGIGSVLYQTHVGSDNKIYTRSSDDGWNWTGWERDESDEYEYTEYPVTLTSINDKLFQVHVGSDNKIYTRSSDGSSEWASWVRGNDPLEDTQSTVSVITVNGTLVQAHKGLSDQVFTRFSYDEGQTWTDWKEFESFVITRTSIGMAAYDNTVWQSTNSFSSIITRKYLGSNIQN